MIEKIIDVSLSKRILVIIIGLTVLVAGVVSWNNLQKEAYPDVGDTQVTIITEFKGRSAKEVETHVTVPLERALNSVPRTINKRSKTIFGLSIIYVTFEDGVKDYWARERVLEKIAEVDLPNGITPVLAPLAGPVGEILRYVVTGDIKYTNMDLRTLQDWDIIPKILQVPGVADVITFGGLVKQYHVITTPEQLSKYNLSVEDIINAIKENNISTGGNIIPEGDQSFSIRGIGAIESMDDIEKIVISSNNGVPVYIKDIAGVEVSPMPKSGILGYVTRDNMNVQPKFVDSGVQGLVLMRRGEDASKVVAGVKERIEQINKDLPQNTQITITYDRGELVNYTIHTVSHTIFEGISIVVIILIFFIGSIRSALVVAMIIPLSLLFAFLMLKVTGISANLLSLGAIDFGIIVDSAVVMVENLLRRYKYATNEERERGFMWLTSSAAKEVSPQIVFSILIIIAAYLPIFTFQRVEGKLFSPMAYTLSFAITGSMLFAITLVPVIMSFVYRKLFEQRKELEWHNPCYDWLEGVYGRALSFLIKKPLKTVLVAFLSLVIITLGSFIKIGSEFLPQLDEGAANIRSFFPVGISLKKADEYTAIIRERLANFKQVKLVVTQLGRNEDGTDPYTSNRLEILVVFHDYKLWVDKISKDDLLKEIKSDLEEHLPGVSFSFSQPILDNVTEAVTGSAADLSVLINGDNLDEMRKIAKEILEIIKNIKGATEYGIEQEADQAQLSIKLKREEIARFGMNVSDVTKVIETAIGGTPIDTVFENGKKFDIVVRYRTDYRSSIKAIQNLSITVPKGPKIPLNQLSDISLKDGPTLIQRQDGQRQISVRTNIRGRDQGGFAKEAQELVAKNVKIPHEYKIQWGGQFENLTRSVERLKIVIPITILIILVILYVLYKNIWDVITVFFCIPFSLIGGLCALLMRGYNLNVSAAVGFISLFGIITMSGVLFVSCMRGIRGDSKRLVTRALVKNGAMLQLRPWIVTVLPALLGLVPATFGSGIGSDIQKPLATVIVGGLTSGLVLTLLCMPSLYIVIDRIRLKIETKTKVINDVSKESVIAISKYVIILMLIVCIFLVFPFRSKAEEIKRISIEEAEQLLLERNIDILSSKLNIDASKAAAIQAKLWPNPNVFVMQNVNRNPSTGRTFDASGRDGNVDVQLQQPVSFSGRFAKQGNVADINTKIAELNYFEALRVMKFQLRTTLYMLYYTEKTIKFFDEGIDVLKNMIAASERLLKRRAVLQTEVLRLKSLISLLRNDRQNFINQMRSLQSDLSILFAEDPNSNVLFMPNILGSKVYDGQINFTLNEAIDIAKKNRPDFKAGELGVDMEKANLKLQKANAIPDVSFGVLYSKSAASYQDYLGAGFSVNIPIFDRNQGNIKQAKVNIVRKTKDLAKQELLIIKDVKLAYLRATDLNKQFLETDLTTEQSYDDLLERMTDAYTKRNINIIEFSDFLESYRNSILQINQLKINRLMAFEELNYVVGTDICSYYTNSKNA